MKKLLLPFLLLLLPLISFTQTVSVDIENLKADNVNVPDGSTINLGTNSSVNVTFRVDLDKEAISLLDQRSYGFLYMTIQVIL